MPLVIRLSNPTYYAKLNGSENNCITFRSLQWSGIYSIDNSPRKGCTGNGDEINEFPVLEIWNLGFFVIKSLILRNFVPLVNQVDWIESGLNTIDAKDTRVIMNSEQHRNLHIRRRRIKNFSKGDRIRLQQLWLKSQCYRILQLQNSPKVYFDRISNTSSSRAIGVRKIPQCGKSV